MDGNLYVLDGGLATEISRKGIGIDNDPLWSARLLSTDPLMICDIHKSYLQHGADIITTGSYQASVEGLCKYVNVTAGEALELIGDSVRLAMQAREWFIDQPQFRNGSRMRPLVAGSVGPYGACCHDGSEYTGNYVDVMTTEALVEWHRPRIRQLVDAGVDLLAIETIPALKEAEAVVCLLKEFPDARGWVAFSCRSGDQTCHGDDFTKSIQAVSASDQIMAMGVNCTSPSYVEPLLVSCQGSSNDKPFIVYPNSGEQWSSGEGWHGSKIGYSPQTCMDLGAAILGGCCRCTPEDVAMIAEVVNARRMCR